MHRVSILFGFLLALGCGGRGDKEMGATCAGNDECADGQCVAGVDGDEGACTRTCAGDDQCPEGWTCSGATADMVLVCVHGRATPLGR